MLTVVTVASDVRANVKQTGLDLVGNSAALSANSATIVATTTVMAADAMDFEWCLSLLVGEDAAAEAWVAIILEEACAITVTVVTLVMVEVASNSFVTGRHSTIAIIVGVAEANTTATTAVMQGVASWPALSYQASLVRHYAAATMAA